MKKVFLLASLFVAGFINSGYSQDTPQASQLLAHYYSLKDALFAGNATTAKLQGEAFVKTANGIDYNIISEGNINALLKDATAISESADIKDQREHFASLSNNMAELAKVVKFTSQPIYKAYCPMKKANWLSNGKEIKNPYFGNAMAGCGEVTETIQ